MDWLMSARFYAVTGRVHGDDEDTCYTCLAVDREAAVREFKVRIREDRDHYHPGDSIYINHVLSSATQIRED